MTIKFSIEGTDYSAELDGSRYTLSRHGINQAKGENFGKPTTIQLGYFSQIKSAVQKAVKEELGNDPSEISLSEFISRYEACVESINNQIGNK